MDVELSLSAAAAATPSVAVVPYNQRAFEHLQRKEATAKEGEEAIVATTRITCAPEPRTDLNALRSLNQIRHIFRRLLPFYDSTSVFHFSFISSQVRFDVPVHISVALAS